MFGFEIPGNSPGIPNIDGLFRSNRKRRFDYPIKNEFDDISEDDEDDKLETLMPAKMDDPLFGSQSSPGIHGQSGLDRFSISPNLTQSAFVAFSLRFSPWTPDSSLVTTLLPAELKTEMKTEMELEEISGKSSKKSKKEKQKSKSKDSSQKKFYTPHRRETYKNKIVTTLLAR